MNEHVATGGDSRASASMSDWQERIKAPLRWIRRDRMVSMLGMDNDHGAVAGLIEQTRFQSRLVELLMRRHRLYPPSALPAPDPRDLPVAQIGPEQASELIHYSGAIFNAPIFASEIRATRVQELKAHFGAHLFATALNWRTLAAAEPKAGLDDAALAEQIERDGSACVVVWLSAQIPALTAWLRLGWAGDERLHQSVIAESVRRQGVAITRTAAAAMAEKADAPEVP